MLRRTFLTALFALTAPALVFAQAKPVTLKLNFADGRKVESKVETKVKQDLVLNGTPIATSNESFATVELVCGKRMADGSISLTQFIRQLQANLDIAGTQINFDSANPDVEAPIPQLQPVIDALKFSLKATRTFTMDGKNKVIDVKLPDGLAVPDIVKAEFSTDALKKELTTLLDVIPTKSISKGDTWEVETESQLGQGQVMTFSKKFTYEGEVEKDGVKLHKITVKVLGVDFDIVNSSLPLTLKSADLKGGESKEEILFDNKTGMVVQNNSDLKITGELKFEAGGNEISGKLDLRITSNTKTRVVE
jgi:hypothetical protein